MSNRKVKELKIERDAHAIGSKTVLPARVRRRGEAVLHQQCWCWGQDIRRVAGNLLLDNGFDKHRPLDGKEGSSAYRLNLSNKELLPRSLTLGASASFTRTRIKLYVQHSNHGQLHL